MQSQKSSKATKSKSKTKKPKVPWGFGSATKKGRVWWLAYRNIKDEIVYENSGTDDAAEASRILARRSLPRARAAVAELERIANEAPETNPGDSEAGGTDRRPGRGRRRTVKDPGQGTETPGGAE